MELNVLNSLTEALFPTHESGFAIPDTLFQSRLDQVKPNPKYQARNPKSETRNPEY